MKRRASTSAPTRLQRAEGVLQPAALPGRRPLWLVGAELCVFSVLELSAVPERHRSRALAERVRQLAPFARPGWHSAELSGRVALWCWDAARVEAAIAETGEASRNWQVLPEQVFLDAADGACLRQIDSDTAILERWDAGRLVFSARLGADPVSRALRYRAAGVAVDAALPALPARLGTRWDLPVFDWRTALREPLLAASLAVLLTFGWLVWSAGELAGVGFANTRLAERVAAREAELAPRLAERDRALALESRNRALGTLLAAPGAIELAAEFEQLVGARYQRMLQWESNARSIRVMLEDKSPDNRAYVEALQQSPWFERVSVAPTLRPEQVSLEIALAASNASTPRYALSATTPGGSSP